MIHLLLAVIYCSTRRNIFSFTNENDGLIFCSIIAFGGSEIAFAFGANSSLSFEGYNKMNEKRLYAPNGKKRKRMAAQDDGETCT